MKRLSERQCVEPPSKHHYHCPLDLLQPTRSGCVGYAIVHALASQPNNQYVDQRDAVSINAKAEELEDFYGLVRSGTSITSGMTAARDLGLISAFEKARTFKEFKEAMKLGPVVVGLNMFQGMDHPLPWAPEWIGITDKKKRLKNEAGEDAGHAMCALGWKGGWNGRLTYLQNSGGAAYGRGGVVKMGDGDMKWLFKKAHIKAYRPIVACG